MKKIFLSALAFLLIPVLSWAITITADTVKVDGTIRFEGATYDSFDTILTVADPTATNTITFPNSSGTVSLNDLWTGLSDTPGSISAGLVVQGNSGGTALEFGQALDTTDSPTFNAITIGSSIPFADSSGVLTLQNVDALDSTTETTIESAIDTLVNLTSIQGQTVSFSGSLTVESASTLNQDLTTDASPTFLSSILTGATSNVSLDLTSTSGALRLNQLTTTQRDALTPLQGMTIFNTTTLQVEDYSGAAWVGATEADEWTELSDTPGSISAGLSVQGNSGGTALEFGQNLTLTGIPTFAGEILKPATAVDVDLIFQNSSGVEKGRIFHDESASFFKILSAEELRIETTTSALLIGTVTGAIDIISGSGSINIQTTSNLVIQAAAAGFVTVTPTIRSGLGTELLPTYTFTGDTDTGMRRSAADTLSFSVGGSEILALSSGTITGPSGTWDSGGMDIAASDSYAVNGTAILSDAAGVMTLSNVDALDATTEATIEAAIDTLSNLTAATSLISVGALNSGSIVSGFGNIDIGSSTLSIEGLTTVGNLRVMGTLADTSGDVGTSGQVISSTVTGTNWVDAANVSNTGTPLDGQVAVFASATVIEGDARLLFDTSDNTLTIGGGGVGDPGGNLIIEGFFVPSFEMVEGDVGAEERRWNTTVDSLVMSHNLLTSGGAGTAYQTITRSASVATAITWTTNQATFSGSLTVDTDTLFVDASAERVGINTSVLISELTFSDDFGVVVTNPNKIALRSDGYGFGVSAGALNIQTDQNIIFYEDVTGTPTERMRIATGGPVGIGVSSLTEVFEVFTDTDVTGIIGRARVGFVGLSDWGGISHFDQGTDGSNYALVQSTSGRTLLNSAAGQNLELRMGNTTKLIIATTGFTGIGSGDLPDTQLHVGASTADTVAVLTTETKGTNAGEFKTFVGSRDPNGNVTGAGGDEYIRDGAALSGSYENLAATTSTVWLKRALNSITTVDLHSAADLDDLAVSTVITTSGVLSLAFKAQISSGSRHSVSSGGTLLVFDATDENNLIYSGTSTLITSVAADVAIKAITIVAATPGTQFFDSTSGTVLPGSDVIEISSGTALVGFNLGTINRVSSVELGSFITIDSVGIIDRTASFTIDSPFVLDVRKLIVDQSDAAGPSDSVFALTPSSYKQSRSGIFDSVFSLYSGESVLKINAGIPDDFNIKLIDNTFTLNGTATVFDTSGSTGAFTAVADNSISSTSITSVVNSSGVASFVHAGTSPLLGSLVTTSGFVISGNEAYNTTGVVTARTSTTFEIDYVAFNATEAAGSYLVDGVTVTATAHGLTTIGTGVTLDTTLSVVFDGGFLIYNIQTNSFDVPRFSTFVATQAGTWSTKGLDQTDIRVFASGNTNLPNSTVLAFGGENSGEGITTVVDGTYGAIVFSAFGEDTISEGFKVTSTTAGIWTLTALEDFKGFLTGGLWAVKSGSTAEYRFTMSLNGAIPSFINARHSPMEVKTSTVGIPLEFKVEMSRGDTIQIMVAGNGTTDDIIITDVIFGIK